MTACPRCTRAGALPARSRATLARDIRICAPCGQTEAARDIAGRAPIPPGEWPVHVQ